MSDPITQVDIESDASAYPCKACGVASLWSPVAALDSAIRHDDEDWKASIDVCNGCSAVVYLVSYGSREHEVSREDFLAIMQVKRGLQMRALLEALDHDIDDTFANLLLSRLERIGR